MSRSATPRLVDIAENIEVVRRLVKGRRYGGFRKDVALRYAVQHAVLIIAEAVKHLPEAIKRKHSGKPGDSRYFMWRQGSTPLS